MIKVRQMVDKESCREVVGCWYFEPRRQGGKEGHKDHIMIYYGTASIAMMMEGAEKIPAYFRKRDF